MGAGGIEAEVKQAGQEGLGLELGLGLVFGLGLEHGPGEQDWDAADFGQHNEF